MAKILDLTAFKAELFELKLLDGTVLYLRKPTQAIFMQFLGFQNFDKSDPKVVLDVLRDMVLAILNTNTAGRNFTAEDIADYDFGIMQAVVQGYSEFINEVMSSPN